MSKGLRLHHMFFLERVIGGHAKCPLMLKSLLSILKDNCCVPSRKTDKVNTLLVPGRRTWKIKHSRFKNPISIVNKTAGCDIWRQNLAWYEIQACAWQNDWVPGKAMRVFMLFYRAHNDMWYKPQSLAYVCLLYGNFQRLHHVILLQKQQLLWLSG